MLNIHSREPSVILLSALEHFYAQPTHLLHSNNSLCIFFIFFISIQFFFVINLKETRMSFIYSLKWHCKKKFMWNKWCSRCHVCVATITRCIKLTSLDCVECIECTTWDVEKFFCTWQQDKLEIFSFFVIKKYHVLALKFISYQVSYKQQSSYPPTHSKSYICHVWTYA